MITYAGDPPRHVDLLFRDYGLEHGKRWEKTDNPACGFNSR